MVTECPCCGWHGYKDGVPQDHDGAILACELCVKSVYGERRLCSVAQEILNRRTEEAV